MFSMLAAGNDTSVYVAAAIGLLLVALLQFATAAPEPAVFIEQPKPTSRDFIGWRYCLDC